MPDDGWVRIYHPDQHSEPPDPDEPEDESKYATVTRESFDTVWEKRGWLDLDDVRVSTDPEDMPESAADRIAWIDEDESLRTMRAHAVLRDEQNRDNPRVTVISHAEDVVAETTSDEDQTPTDDISTEV